MLTRYPPDLLAFAGSALVLAGLIGALFLIDAPGEAALQIYCAETLREPLTAIANQYEREYHQKVALYPGASQTILVHLELNKNADLFLPADESHMRVAQNRKLVYDVQDVARMRLVLIVNRQYPKKIASWSDVVAPGVKIGLGNPETAAVGKLVKDRLQADGLWNALEIRKPVYLGSVSEVRNAVLLGTVDVGVVWDVIARPMESRLTIVRLPELDKVEAVLQIGIADSSAQSENARRFIRFLRAADKGGRELKAFGFSSVAVGPAMDEDIERETR